MTNLKTKENKLYLQKNTTLRMMSDKSYKSKCFLPVLLFFSFLKERFMFTVGRRTCLRILMSFQVRVTELEKAKLAKWRKAVN